MTDLEKIIRLVLDNIYTSLPCKVIEYDGKTRFAKCELYTKTKKEGNTPLIRVPILRMVGGSVPLKPGMIIPVWFSKYTLGEFLTSLSKQIINGPLQEMQFSRNNAYGLPFLFDDKLNIEMPEFVEFDTRVIFKETVLVEKEAEFLKDVTINSNLIVKGNTDIKGNMSSENYNKHTHMEQGDGKPTGPPQ